MVVFWALYLSCLTEFCPDIHRCHYRLCVRRSYCRIYEWLPTEFWLVIRFIGHSDTQLVITLNYIAIASFHTLQNHAVFTSSCLVTISNNGYSYASGLKSSLNSGSLPTMCTLDSVVLLINPRHGPFQQYLHCCRGDLFVCDCCIETAQHATHFRFAVYLIVLSASGTWPV
jgi:hypothetical protein